MPELPEAETIARGLRPHVVGRVVADVEVVHEDVLRVPPAALRAAVVRRRIESVDRRGKNVLLHLSGDRVVVVNLGMTGRLLPRPATGVPVENARPEPTHPAVVFRFTDGSRLVYHDVRRFGCVEALEGPAWRDRDEALGREPLDEGFTADDLHTLLSASRSPVRNWLLDQRRVAGVGNIYAAEALFRAGIHPLRPAREVDETEARALHAGLRDVLREAIDARGTSFRDYRDASGRPGGFVRSLAVYGREGEPCPTCGTPVEREVLSNRSAFFCPHCQPT